MAGYIGSKSSVTQVDGYNQAEADAEFVNDPNSVITVSGSNVGIGTSSPRSALDIDGGVDTHIRMQTNSTGSSSLDGLLLGLDGSSNALAYFWNYENAPVIVGTNNAERMRIDSSGNVDITSGNLFTDTTSGIFFSGGIGSFTNGVYGVGVNNVAFAVNNAERMRLDSSGNLLVGTTSLDSAFSGVQLRPTVSVFSSTSDVAYFRRNLSNGGVLIFQRDGAVVGSVTVTGSATSYNTSSDYRLKTDAQPMTGASARVQALKPVNFEWLSDGTRVDGFLAHEAQEVVPEAVTGTKDAMRDEEYEVTPAVYEDVVIPAVLDEDGNELEAERTEQQLVTEAVMGTRSVPDYQGIDQSKLVPLLTAALQEALTKIDDMETRLAALEAV